MTTSSRRILLVTNTRRAEAASAAREARTLLLGAGIVPVVSEQDTAGLREAGFPFEGVDVLGVHCAVAELELVVVLGGDGTILRAADLVHAQGIPVVGINLGHVGFLAESERADLVDALTSLAEGRYDVEERTSVSVELERDGSVVYHSWALNEVTVEKKAPSTMIGVRLSVDGEPLTSFAADGVMVSTPTGSTAYAFSAGGPIMWPDVDALLVTPLNAHALFARTLVIPPTSTVSIEVVGDMSPGLGAVWCDSARTYDAPIGAVARIRRSETPVRLARLKPASFVNRLVNKFNLPTESWRNR